MAWVKLLTGILFLASVVLGVLTYTTQAERVDAAAWRKSARSEMLLGRTIAWPSDRPFPGGIGEFKALVLNFCVGCSKTDPYELAQRAGARAILVNSARVEGQIKPIPGIVAIVDDEGRYLPSSVYIYGSCVLTLRSSGEGQATVVAIEAAPHEELPAGAGGAP